jgi:hypothetical protein
MAERTEVIPQAAGPVTVRAKEAALPKLRCKVTAAMRQGHKFAYAGGYADRDGLHVSAAVFKADGRERTYEFTAPMIRRLQKNMPPGIIVVSVDEEALMRAEKAGGEVTVSDVLQSRAAQLEAENLELKRQLGAVGTARSAMQEVHEVDDIDDEHDDTFVDKSAAANREPEVDPEAGLTKPVADDEETPTPGKAKGKKGKG